MTYDITKPTAPKMPKLGKGLECIKLLASQISPDMREAIVPMLFPALGAYVSGSEFQYADLTWKELCGQMAHLVADSGMGKGQLTACVETIMRKRRQHDEEELQKLVEWQKTVKTKGANKEKLGGGIVTCHVNAPVSLSQYAPIAGAHGGAPLQLR